MNNILLDRNYRALVPLDAYDDKFVSIAGEVLDYVKKGIISKSVAGVLLKMILQREFRDENYNLFVDKTTNLLHVNIESRSKKKLYE